MPNFRATIANLELEKLQAQLPAALDRIGELDEDLGTATRLLNACEFHLAEKAPMLREQVIDFIT